MLANKMTTLERRAVLSLATILSLRMIGLFMVLPLFVLYAQTLPGATPLLIGFSIGSYGLTQALLQIPFGTLSDRIGRKPVIIFGLIIFAIGSLLAAFSHSIGFLILGRALQGAGAIGSTVLAYLSDLTREEQRTKAMAIAGITIGFSFSLAMIIGPILSKWLPINELFLLATFFAVIAIVILLMFVPKLTVIKTSHQRRQPWWDLLFQRDLAKLNAGIFILHAIFTASFIAIPLNLAHNLMIPASRQWEIYLPTLLLAAIISLLMIGIAERKRQVKKYFIFSIINLFFGFIFLWQFASHLFLMSCGLLFFFIGFSTLEAFLPSLISRTAPPHRKGNALGIYSFAQFSGIFVGGLFGGWIYGQFHFAGIYFFCLSLSLLWLFLACFMQSPRYLITQTFHVPIEQQHEWKTIATKLSLIPGIVEVFFIAEENIAYLKMEKTTVSHPDFIRLKEEMNSPSRNKHLKFKLGG